MIFALGRHLPRGPARRNRRRGVFPLDKHRPSHSIGKQAVTITIAGPPPVETEKNLLRGALRPGKLEATSILPAAAIAVR